MFAALVGLYTGGPNSIMTPITLKLVPIEDLPAAHGLEYFFSGLGYVPGPFVAGRIIYLLSAPRRDKTCLAAFENNKGADQNAHPCSLISAFVIRLLESSIFKLASSKTLIF